MCAKRRAPTESGWGRSGKRFLPPFSPFSLHKCPGFRLTQEDQMAIIPPAYHLRTAGAVRACPCGGVFPGTLDRAAVNGPTSYRWSGAAYLVGIIMCQLSLAHLSAMAEGRQRLIQDDLAVTGRFPGAPLRRDDAPLLHQPSSLATDWVAGYGDGQPMPDAAPSDGNDGETRWSCDSSSGQACRSCWWWPGHLCGRFCHGRVWQKLTLFRPASMFRHSSTSPRAIGKGEPLLGTSWLNRPYYAGWFLGPMFGDSPIDGMDQGNGAFGGLVLGWDVDHYWGTQLRFGWAAMRLTERDSPQRIRNDDVFISDLSLLYYPWGDSRWRPYGLLGLGLASFSFADQRWIGHDTTLLGMPFGGGLKYQFRRWWAIRAEVLDNVAYGSEGLNTMHNVSLTIDMEVRWGAKPKSYWPWRPERRVW